MAWRMAHLVVEGELDNTVKGCVTGWLRLAGRDELLRLELGGNCRPDLAGWRFRIVRLEPIPAWAKPVDLDGFATEQIGEAGDILADQMLRHYDCPVDELLARIRAGEPPPTDLRPALYLEWYSDQNGRVVIQDTRLGVERLGRRTFELTAKDLRLEHEEGEQRLDELRRQGYVIEETPLGVLGYHKDDSDEPRDDSLQAEFDQEAERIDRAIQDSLENPPESEDTWR
ncbi:MAG: hypothetical protein NTY19_19875 [Planctomycetota bacterium]|nr:hypothetical protein [Planctomycetota bacterium]